MHGFVHRSIHAVGATALLTLASAAHAQITVDAGIQTVGGDAPVGATHYGQVRPTVLRNVVGDCLNCPPQQPISFSVCHLDNCTGPGAPVPGGLTGHASVASGWSGFMRFVGPLVTDCPGMRLTSNGWVYTTGECRFFLMPMVYSTCNDPGVCDPFTLRYHARYGSLAGSVRFVDGSPAAYTTVVVSNDEGVFPPYTVITDQNGAFSITCGDAERDHAWSRCVDLANPRVTGLVSLRQGPSSL
jgi:hypothetical protein